MKNKIVKRVFIFIAALISLVLIAAVIAFIVLSIRTLAIRDDYSSVFSNDKYSTPVSVDGVEVITQDVSCGYAVLEMFSKWSGHDVTEKSLYEEYGKVVTSTGKAFENEMNKRFPEYKTKMQKYLKNTELIDMVYINLSKGIPIPIEWAALYKDEWTLHYSLVTGMDVKNNKVTIANPYGYYEEITIDEFLKRTRFDSFENMPLFLKLGFAFGIFEKNTVFAVSK